MGSSTLPWRFDALDARAGLAFASQRAGFSLVDDALLPDNPAVFISSPDFLVEHLSSSVLGYVAARSSFQLGLFLGDETEAGFNSLPELIEFARRCYVRGAGGDGNGAGEWDTGLPTVPGETGGSPPPSNRPRSARLILHLVLREVVHVCSRN
jgi:hypothetical protein